MKAGVAGMGEAAVEDRKLDAAAAPLAHLHVWGRVLEAGDGLDSGVPRISTGLPRLDAALGGGFAMPSLNVIGAGPKSFKSTLAQIIATQHVEAGGTAYILDLENGEHRFLRRLLCRRARLGPSEVVAALQGERDGVFRSRQDAERWRAAKVWARDEIGPRLFVEFSPPADFARRVADVRTVAGDRSVLVVVDSLQKLPTDFTDRRASTDRWIRLFERLRYEHNLVILVISEIKRDLRGGYSTHESAFKESGGIEYAADLAMTLERASADDDDSDGTATLRVQLARDAEEDPRGDVASYRPERPFYGLEEVDPVPAARRRQKGPGPAPAKREGAAVFLRDLLANGAETVKACVERGKAAGYSRATVYRAREAIGAVECTVRLKNGWRLPT